MVVLIPFLSFKGIIHTCFLKISITHNKERIPLINLLINGTSVRFPTKTLSIKVEYTFLILNFLITGLNISSANYLVYIFSFLIALLEVLSCQREALSNLF